MMTITNISKDTNVSGGRNPWLKNDDKRNG